MRRMPSVFVGAFCGSLLIADGAWNFVSSTPDRIHQAALDWREGRFPKVPGDEQEFSPLPEGRPKIVNYP